MKLLFEGLDNQDYPIQIGERRENASKGHLLARQIILDTFPKLPLFEEVTIRFSATKYGFLDFLVPNVWIAIEVQGTQHSSFSSFFHGDKMGFYKSQGRDKQKRDWCQLNEIRLVEFKYGEESKWDALLKSVLLNE